MKKKLNVFLSLLLAFVMSFALFACNPGDDVTVEYTSERAITAMTTLAKAEGLKGSAEAELYSGGEKSYLARATFDKRGDKILLEASAGESEAELDETKILVDLGTGLLYGYSEHENDSSKDGWNVIESIMPQGMLAYVEKALGQVGGDKESDVVGSDEVKAAFEEVFTVVPGKRAVKTSYNAADKVNKLLDPVYNAYANPTATLEDLINSYLALIPHKEDAAAITVSGVFDTIIAALTVDEDDEAGINLGDMTLGQIVVVLDTMLELEGDQSIGAMLDKALKEMNATDAVIAQVKARKLSEMVEGLYQYIKALVNNMPSTGASSIDYKSILTAGVQYVLFEQVDVTNVVAHVTELKGMLIGWLQNTKVKETLDKLALGNSYFGLALVVIKNKVKLTDLSYEIEVSFDNKMNVSGITADFKFAHNYTGNLLPIAKSYEAKVNVTVDTVSATAAPMTVKYAADFEPRLGANAIVVGEDTADVKVFCETGNAAVTFESATIEYATAAGQSASLNTGVTYDAASKTFTVSRATVNAIKNNTDAAIEYGMSVDCKVKVDGEDKTISLDLIYVDDYSAEAIGKLVSSMLPM